MVLHTSAALGQIDAEHSDGFAEAYAEASSARDALISGELELAARQAEPLAEAGNPVSQNVLGLALTTEGSPVFDAQAGLIWLQRAGEQGYPKGYYNLAVTRESGVGEIPSDVEQAQISYVRCAELAYAACYGPALWPMANGL